MQVNWLNCLFYLRRDCFLAYALVRVILDYCQRQIRIMKPKGGYRTSTFPLEPVFRYFRKLILRNQLYLTKIFDNTPDPRQCVIVVSCWALLFLCIFFMGMLIRSFGARTEGLCSREGCQVCTLLYSTF